MAVSVLGPSSLSPARAGRSSVSHTNFDALVIAASGQAGSLSSAQPSASSVSVSASPSLPPASPPPVAASVPAPPSSVRKRRRARTAGTTQRGPRVRSKKALPASEAVEEAVTGRGEEGGGAELGGAAAVSSFASDSDSALLSSAEEEDSDATSSSSVVLPASPSASSPAAAAASAARRPAAARAGSRQQQLQQRRRRRKQTQSRELPLALPPHSLSSSSPSGLSYIAAAAGGGVVTATATAPTAALPVALSFTSSVASSSLSPFAAVTATATPGPVASAALPASAPSAVSAPPVRRGTVTGAEDSGRCATETVRAVREKQRQSGRAPILSYRRTNDLLLCRHICCCQTPKCDPRKKGKLDDEAIDLLRAERRHLMRKQRATAAAAGLPLPATDEEMEALLGCVASQAVIKKGSRGQHEKNDALHPHCSEACRAYRAAGRAAQQQQAGNGSAAPPVPLSRIDLMLDQVRHAESSEDSRQATTAAAEAAAAAATAAGSSSSSSSSSSNGHSAASSSDMVSFSLTVEELRTLRLALEDYQRRWQPQPLPLSAFALASAAAASTVKTEPPQPQAKDETRLRLAGDRNRAPQPELTA